MPEIGLEHREVFNDDHRQFRDTVRRFFRKDVEPNYREWEKQGMFPAEVFRKAGAAGILHRQDHVVDQLPHPRRGRVLDRLRMRAQHRMPHMGDFQQSHAR